MNSVTLKVFTSKTDLIVHKGGKAIARVVRDDHGVYNSTGRKRVHWHLADTSEWFATRKAAVNRAVELFG